LDQNIGEVIAADTVHLESGLDFTVLEPLLTDYRGQVSALVAPVQPDAKDNIPPSLVGRILNLLKSHFDFVVVDTSPSFDEYALQAFDETDEMLLVTTLDVPTLKNVKVAVETFDALHIARDNRHLLLNRADDEVGINADKVEGILGMPVDVQIVSSLDIAAATNAGSPVIVTDRTRARWCVSRAVFGRCSQSWMPDTEV